MPTTSLSQSRRSIDVMWRHTLSLRYSNRQKSLTESIKNVYYRLNEAYGCWRDKSVISKILQTNFGPKVCQKQTLSLILEIPEIDFTSQYLLFFNDRTKDDLFEIVFEIVPVIFMFIKCKTLCTIE